MLSGLRLRLLTIFALMILGNVAAISAGIFLAWKRSPEALTALATLGIVAAFGTVLVTVLAWLLFDDVARGMIPVLGRTPCAGTWRRDGRCRHL